jgi:hypothetical protein
MFRGTGGTYRGEWHGLCRYLEWTISPRLNVTITDETNMIGLADRIEITPFAPERERRSEWAPYRTAAHEEERRVRSWFSGFGVLAAFVLFSGITAAVARGHAGLAQSYGVSPQSLLVAAWLIQGASALFCFVLAVRWLRSESH